MRQQISCEVADVADPAFQAEVDRLVKLNYGETGPAKLTLELGMNWEAMIHAQQGGFMYVVAARQPQHLVGYAVVWLASHPTYCGQTVAQCSALFVESEARRSGAGLALIRKMTREAKQRDADVFLMGCPLNGDAETLFRSLRWEPVETLFAKVLR